MEELWDPNSTSTIVSDVSSVRSFEHEWNKVTGKKWRKVTHEDEIEELAVLVDRSQSSQHSLLSTVAASALFPLAAMMKSVPTDRIKDRKEKVESILHEARNHQVRSPDNSVEIQPFLHIWDCGGQPVFLEILPAFLTSRNMFLLLFDASKDLNEKWQSVQNLDGQQSLEEEIDETTGDLMVKWMSTIHGHLVKHEADGSLCDYPRLYCVGTHGDKLGTEEKKKEVKERATLILNGKAFSEFVADVLIVDNTTSGKGQGEDPNLTRLRNAISKFVREKLIVKTPVNWVLFRKVLQILKENVITITEAHAIGVACQIPAAHVPKVLRFYHEVGAVLFYPHLKGLSNKVIINPKWFVKTLGKVFTLEGREESHTKLTWQLLHEKGILVQPFYVNVWRESKNDINPEDMMELLVHFRLAAQVHTEEYYNPNVKQYFLPAVLKGFRGDPSEAPPDHKLRATPLHITFTTGFVPPGFFTRLATTLAGSSTCKLIFYYGIYRNRITFLHGRPPIDHLTLTDLHHAIQVDVLRYVPENNKAIPSFKNVCQKLKVFLEECCKEVEATLLHSHHGDDTTRNISDSVGVRKFQYFCDKCSNEECHHYLEISDEQMTCTLPVHCQRNRIHRPLTDKESFWFEGEEIDLHESSLDISGVNPSSITRYVSKPLTQRDVVSLLTSIQSKWFEIGIALNVGMDTLNGLVASSSSNTVKLANVINTWMDKGEGVTWSALIKAVEGPIVDNQQ